MRLAGRLCLGPALPAPTPHHGSAAHSTSNQLAPTPPSSFDTGKHAAMGVAPRSLSSEVPENLSEQLSKVVVRLNQAENAVVEIITFFELVKFQQERTKVYIITVIRPSKEWPRYAWFRGKIGIFTKSR